MVTVVVLLSFLLVLAAAVTLVIGLLNSGLGLIYVSIGCSVAAGIVLALAVVRNRPREAVGTSVGTERLRALDTEGEPTVTVVPPRGADADEEAEVEVLDVEPARAGVRGDGAGVFPIADYDDLKVGEIVALLVELDADELEMVREREAGGKNRSTILTRVEALTEAADAAGWGVGERQWEEDWGEAEAEGVFPIADYDELKVAEIVPLLPELDADELDLVREREQRGANRGTILSRIDNLLAGEEEEAAPPPPKRAPAKKTAAKKTTTKRAPAKKTAAKKTTTKRAPAKKTVAKKTAKKASGARKR
jgi:hypothetical protein